MSGFGETIWSHKVHKVTASVCSFCPFLVWDISHRSDSNPRLLWWWHSCEQDRATRTPLFNQLSYLGTRITPGHIRRTRYNVSGGAPLTKESFVFLSSYKIACFFWLSSALPPETPTCRAGWLLRLTWNYTIMWFVSTFQMLSDWMDLMMIVKWVISWGLWHSRTFYSTFCSCFFHTVSLCFFFFFCAGYLPLTYLHTYWARACVHIDSDFVFKSDFYTIIFPAKCTCAVLSSVSVCQK